MPENKCDRKKKCSRVAVTSHWSSFKLTAPAVTHSFAFVDFDKWRNRTACTAHSTQHTHAHIEFKTFAQIEIYWNILVAPFQWMHFIYFELKTREKKPPKSRAFSVDWSMWRALVQSERNCSCFHARCAVHELFPAIDSLTTNGAVVLLLLLFRFEWNFWRRNFEMSK